MRRNLPKYRDERDSQSFIKSGGTDGSEKMEWNRRLTGEWKATEREREKEKGRLKKVVEPTVDTWKTDSNHKNYDILWKCKKVKIYFGLNFVSFPHNTIWIKST